jgi:hypothetical protein
MFAGDETVRQAYRRLHDQLGKSAPAELGARAEALDRAFVDQGITFSLSGQERPFLRRVRAHPRGWIAQPVVQLSTVPTKVGQRLRPRHVDLRPFAVNDGNSVFVLPGGLTRVAIPEGSLIVNSSQGGGSKDTWVLAARSSTQDAEWTVLARNAESLYWIGRYVERADDTARILDVSVHHLLEDATVDADATSRQLLAVLGITPPDAQPLDVRPLTDLVAFSREHAGSIEAGTTGGGSSCSAGPWNVST